MDIKGTGQRIAVMQPMYLPWMGYFALIESVDVFVFLDNVQFSHGGWQQRNRVRQKDNIVFLTVPVYKKGLHRQIIRDVEIADQHKWRKSHYKTLYQSYSKALYWEQYQDILFEMYNIEYNKLCELNIFSIIKISKLLKLKAKKMIRASELVDQTDRVGRLISLCDRLGADEYLSPVGSFEYIDRNNLFEKNNISLKYLHFEHPEYRQVGKSFLSHLSIIDLLLNEGPNAKAILKSGIRKPFTHEELKEARKSKKGIE